MSEGPNGGDDRARAERWKWGDELEEGEREETSPMLSPEQEQILAEAELLLATGRTIDDIAKLLKENKADAGGKDDDRGGS